MISPFKIIPAEGAAVPILISVPHCGTAFPSEIKNDFESAAIVRPDDTDWFVDRLYNFAPAMGITMIVSHYSRWVIDLNRNPNDKPLYNDGRIITALCPTTNFLHEPIYRDKRKAVDPVEVSRRLSTYYQPYHDQIQIQLDALRKKFGMVLLWDCHSIRQVVPTIQKEKFPDLILGDVDGVSCDDKFITTALTHLRKGDFSLHHNHPFKGGTITRYFGKPEMHQHALQLEMTKVNYMNDAEDVYDETRANRMRVVLQQTFQHLITALTKN